MAAASLPQHSRHPLTESQDFGVRSLSSSDEWSSQEPSSPTVSTAASDETAAEATTPSLYAMTLADQLQFRATARSRSRTSTRSSPPGSPASFASSFDHLSDASRPGLLSLAPSDTDEAVVSNKESSGEDGEAQAGAHSQLVMPRLPIQSSTTSTTQTAAAGASSLADDLRLCVIGSMDDSSASLLRDCAAKATWPADLDPAVAIYRLETFFDEAQRLLRDDIPRHLMSTLRKVVEAMPDLAPFDALILPMGCPPSSHAVELAAALHPLVNLLIVVDNDEEAGVHELEKQLTSQGIKWLRPTCSAFFSQTSLTREVMPHPVDLRRGIVDLFLEWRDVDACARSDVAIPTLRDAAFASRVLRRRDRLFDHVETISSADSGAAADDEGTETQHTPARPRPAVTAKACGGAGGWEDPLAFDARSVARLGLDLVRRVARNGADLAAAGVVVVAIFGVGLGIGWIGSLSFASVVEAVGEAWSVLGLGS